MKPTQVRRPKQITVDAPARNGFCCDVDYRKYRRGLKRSLSYMEMLLGEG